MRSAAAVALVLVVLAACATTGGASAPASVPPSLVGTPTPPTAPPATPIPPTPSPAPPSCPPLAEGAADPCTVPAAANIFGAGHPYPPAPAGGGRGSLPPVLVLPAGARAVSFPSITGQVTPIKDNGNFNGPGGDKKGPTDIDSFEGIAGIVDRRNGMFLTVVFLADTEPADPTPARLDFTNKEQFALLEPEIAQVFFVGDGADRLFRVPAGATRLFLGFADGYFYDGPPGWYGNNAGELVVTIAVTME